MSYNGLEEDYEAGRILKLRIGGYLDHVPENLLTDPTLTTYRAILDEEAAIAPFLVRTYQFNGHESSTAHALGLAEDEDARYFAQRAGQ